MHPLLNRLLEKRGIKGVEELMPEEKADFDRYQKVLSEGEMTLEKLTSFIETQIKLLEAKLRDLDNSSQKNDRLICTLNVYKVLSQSITAPLAEREALERYLNSLLTS